MLPRKIKMEDQKSFQENVKNTFLKVKKHNESIEAKISQIKAVLEEIKLKFEVPIIPKKAEDLEVPEENLDPISTGNEGVNKHTNLHTYKPTYLQTYIPTDVPRKSKEALQSLSGLENIFRSLTKQEFHIFLLIYQLEDENINPTYQEISKRLSLTYGCLRAYICSMLKKGIPIYKKKLEDNSIIFYINKDFKAIASQRKLVDTYYSLKATKQSQKTLFDL